jgi:Rrf2 family protein
MGPPSFSVVTVTAPRYTVADAITVTLNITVRILRMKSKTEFSSAIHVLLSLLDRRGDWLNSNELAESVGSHPVMIRRLVSKLVKAGLIESRTGRDGGVRLKKDPKRISAYDILHAVDGGELVKLHQSPAKKECPVSCQIAQIMEKVKATAETAVNEAFMKLSLHQLYSKMK